LEAALEFEISYAASLVRFSFLWLELLYRSFMLTLRILAFSLFVFVILARLCLFAAYWTDQSWFAKHFFTSFIEDSLLLKTSVSPYGIKGSLSRKMEKRVAGATLF